MRGDVWLGAGLAVALMPWSLPASQVRACEATATEAVAAAALLLDEADEIGAERELRAAFVRHPDCALLAVAFWATTGLQHARHAATRGGPPELLAPVVEAVERLEARRQQPGAVRAAQYAQGALRAAAAAAQDERPELQIWLTHTADLAARLDPVGERPRWPLPAALLAGDLWYEVDRYAEARDAYRTALALSATAYGQRGLARALNRLGETAAACDAYRQLTAWPSPHRVSAAALAEARAYLDGVKNCRM